MAAIPKPQSQIPALVYASREAENEAWDGLGFSPSDLGSACDRYLWLRLHWGPAQEAFDGRMLRLFETGHIQEERLIADLRRAGIEVYDLDPDTGKQWLARAIGGHVRGKLDGIATSGVPEAPAKTHVVECKSHSDKSFRELEKKRVKEGKFEHWAQCQVYMHIRGIDRSLYVAVNKNTDALYVERIEYDHEWCSLLFARLTRILEMPRPPAPISTNDKSPDCIFCKARPLCRGQVFGRLSCRTCLHSAPDMSGDAAWSCSRWTKPLSVAEQREGCPAHLYVPDLVPGEQVDVDEERETITYLLRDGRTWVDGQDVAEVPAAIHGEAE